MWLENQFRVAVAGVERLEVLGRSSTSSCADAASPRASSHRSASCSPPGPVTTSSTSPRTDTSVHTTVQSAPPTPAPGCVHPRPQRIDRATTPRHTRRGSKPSKPDGAHISNGFAPARHRTPALPSLRSSRRRRPLHCLERALASPTGDTATAAPTRRVSPRRDKPIGDGT